MAHGSRIHNSDPSADGATPRERGADAKYVYDFAEGSREMRDLLGGKGANIAEMTRLLGADLVPAGFMITTEACVRHDRRRRAAGLDDAGRRGARAPRAARRPAASATPTDPLLRLGALRRARVDAGHDGHRPQPRPERPLGDRARARAPATSASPGTPTGASCRCSPTSCAASRASGSRTTIAAGQGSATASRLDTELDVDALRELTGDLQALFREQTGEEFPQDPAEQLRQAILAVFDSWMRRSRGRLPAHQPHPRRLGHRRQRAADGLRQQGRAPPARASPSAATR